jgi:hypothetical protein
MNERLQKLLLDTKSAFKTPTLKQKEAYGRLAHTMSAASLIGSVTVMFTEPSLTVSVGSRIGALVFWGVLLFWVGALLSKGE